MRVRLGRQLAAAALLMVLAAPAAAAAQDPAGRTAGRDSTPGVLPAFDIERIDPETFRAIAVRIPEGRSPRIDGKLDDEVWGLAPVAGNFVQREPQFGQPSTEKTEFRILYDDRRWTSYSAGYTSNQAKRVYGGVGGEAGGYYNGDRQSIRAAINFQIGRTMLLEPNYTKNWITLPGREPYVSNTLNFRVSQSFSPDLFVKAFMQYNDERRTASVNLLFWYIYKPGSDLYLVYNEGRETGIPDRWSRPRNRSLAVKMTYWLAR